MSATVFDREKVLEEARTRLSALYERFVEEIEREADRILREKLAQLEPIKKELEESLRTIS